MNKFPFEQAYYWCLVLIVASLIYSTAVNSCAIILMAVFWILEGNWQDKWHRLRQSKLAILFISFFLINLISFAYTVDVPAGLSILQRLLPLLAFPLILSTIPLLDTRKVERIFAWFILSCFVAAIISLFGAFRQYIRTGETEQFFYQQIGSFARLEAIYFSLYTGFCIIVLVWLLFMKGQRMNKIRYAVAVLMIVAFVAVFLLLSIRTAIAGLMLLGLAGLIAYHSRRGRLLKGIALAVLLIALAGTAIVLNPVSRQKFEEAFAFDDAIRLDGEVDQSLGRTWGGRALRVAIWQCAWDIVREHPVTGVGLGDVQEALQNSYRNNNFLFAADYNRYNAHNQFIETQLGAGVFGLVTLIAVFALPAFYALKHSKYLYVLFILFIWMNCLTESLFMRQKGAIFYSTFNSIFAFHCLTRRTPQ